MIIRKPTARDRERLLELYYEFDRFNHAEGSITLDMEPFEEDLGPEKDGVAEYIDQFCAGKDYFGYVAEEDGKIIGFTAGSMKAREGYKLDNEGFIEEWYMVESKRHQGIGRQLYDALIAEFKQRGATHLGLDAFAGNKPAIEMYKRMGFVESEVVMRRKLDD